MIIREAANGETIVIGQTDHSRLVGQLAAHWGNAEVARQSVLGPALLGPQHPQPVTHHRYRFSRAPRANTQTSTPKASSQGARTGGTSANESTSA